MSKTFYIPYVAILDRDITESYKYRRNKETLGLLFYTVNDNKWNIIDYMNDVKMNFDTEKQAKDFIRESTPIYV